MQDTGGEEVEKDGGNAKQSVNDFYLEVRGRVDVDRVHLKRREGKGR